MFKVGDRVEYTGPDSIQALGEPMNAGQIDTGTIIDIDYEMMFPICIEFDDGKIENMRPDVLDLID